MMFVLPVHADDVESDNACGSCVVSEDSLETVNDTVDVPIEDNEDKSIIQLVEGEEDSDIGDDEDGAVDEDIDGVEDIIVEDDGKDVDRVDEDDMTDDAVVEDLAEGDDVVVSADNMIDEITIENGDDEGQAEEECMGCLQCIEDDAVCPQEVVEDCGECDSYDSCISNKLDCLDIVVDGIWARSNMLRSLFRSWMDCDLNMHQRPVGSMLSSLMCGISLGDDQNVPCDTVEQDICNEPVDADIGCEEVDLDMGMNTDVCVDDVIEEDPLTECVGQGMSCENQLVSASVSVNVEMSYGLDIGMGRLLAPVWGVPCYVALETCDAEAGAMSCAAVNMASDICI